MSENLTPTLEVAGTEITMSFGLLNELAKLVGSVERLSALDFDFDLTVEALTACLAPRTPKGRRDPEYVIPVDLKPLDAEKIVDWAKSHILEFFLRRLEANLSQLETSRDRLKAVGSLLIGTAG